jgi:hypothetical protein
MLFVPGSSLRNGFLISPGRVYIPGKAETKAGRMADKEKNVRRS